MGARFKRRINDLYQSAQRVQIPFQREALKVFEEVMCKTVRRHSAEVEYIGTVNGELIVVGPTGQTLYSMNSNYPAWADKLDGYLTEYCDLFGWPPPMRVTNEGEVFYKYQKG